ncbi:PRP3-domain-containing protein [Byssothecium circinans]|uniref:PRP3-domain-containing protein n=1 Tax=Byssothecium circinans TaxID=147558 RepID=A0A6A5UIZ6_9PLEO|nr:PRP3-domain-containing protein [Byssothecium circinans]
MAAEKRPHPSDQGDPNKRPKSDAFAAAKAKAAEIAAKARARAAASKAPEPAPVRQSQGASPAPPSAAPAGGLSRLDAIRARIAAQNASSSGSIVSGGPVTPVEPPRPSATLDIRRTDAKARAPSPKREDEKPNPYFDPKAVSTGRVRATRQLQFNEVGKYTEQGSKLRAQQRLEQIKKTLAMQARRAGLDENSERGFLVQTPPDVEWWDEGLLEEKTYDCLDDPAKLKLHGDDTVITLYVQHPSYLKAPQDQRLIVTKPMYLTPKEQAKLRRMRRAEEIKEQQAKIRLGLEPPPPPKVKRGNMMRVMGEQAIADPTAVEMMVESQIQERHDNHLAANEERKLTKEQRHAKIEEQQQKDAAKALYMCVFKIDTLAFGQHRYKIDNNAKQMALTGITLFNPNMNLVIVEGGIHSVNKYKKLMLQRIKWSDNAPPTDIQMEKQASDPQWMKSFDEEGNLKDLSYNKCKLVFEGEVKERAFRKWGSKTCETDGEAKHFLSRNKIDSLWALAQSLE